MPWILKEDGKSRFFEGDYKFTPGKDEIMPARLEGDSTDNGRNNAYMSELTGYAKSKDPVSSFLSI